MKILVIEIGTDIRADDLSCNVAEPTHGMITDVGASIGEFRYDGRGC